jgi:hypothetical protein
MLWMIQSMWEDGGSGRNEEGTQAVDDGGGVVVSEFSKKSLT